MVRTLLSTTRNALFATRNVCGSRALRWGLVIVLSACLGYYLKGGFGHKTPPLHLEKQILSEDKLKSKFTYDGINMSQGNGCRCDAREGLQVYRLKDYLAPADAPAAAERRRREYQHFQKRQLKQSVILAPPHSPLRYPFHGLQVWPLHTLILPGLEVHLDPGKYLVTLQASLGTLDTLTDVSGIEGCRVSGRGEKLLTISAHRDLLNQILQRATYTSIEYSIDALDIIIFTMGQHVAQVPISIRQPAMVRLYDPGAGRKIGSLVTITTKTFLRYDKLRELLRSIRQYYPDIRVIVADDNEVTQKIQGDNVEQYIMPFAKGWFAGRNLAVSQVTTKYFLWVDDDFVFTGDTKIEKLLDVLEETDLDLVGGSVAGNHFCFKLLLEEGGEEGDCLHWRAGGYQKIEGFPDCVLTGGVVNFFLARTDRVLSVGFDPKLQRVAHTEFFVDGLGRLRVGSCSHVSIGHQDKKPPTDEAMAQVNRKYDSFRANTQEQVKYKLGLHYFKNRLSCFTKR